MSPYAWFMWAVVLLVVLMAIGAVAEVLRESAGGTSMRRFLDWLLGERCHVCGLRVFPGDLVKHYRGCGQR